VFPFQRSLASGASLSVLDFSVVAAQALGIPDTSDRRIFRINEISHDLTIKQAEFLKQRRMTARRKRLDQVFDHRAQPSYNLQIVRPAESNLLERQMDEVFPVRCPENHAELSGAVQYLVGAQMTAANHAQHAVELVDRENGCGRIVNRRR
jgi:hypothetical protein